MTAPIKTSDLTADDREPIHIPGSIQPHGLLLALTEPALDVSQASANTAEYLGLKLHQVLGAPLTELFESDDVQRLLTALGGAKLDQNPVYLCNISSAAAARSFYAIAHRFAGSLIVEFEPADSSVEISFQTLYSVMRNFMAQLKEAGTVQSLAQLASAEVRRITGFGRVLVYKFAPSWDGHVIAESRRQDYSSYLDQWFPASGIPKEARELYTVNRFRLIADAGSRPVPVLPAINPATGKPLDMSYAALRSASPVDIEYLKNIGVISFMSLSILGQNGKLWGLICCHHAAPRLVPFDLRIACDLLAQSLSIQIEAKEQHADNERRIALQPITSRLLSFLAQEDDFVRGLTCHPDDLLRFANASGAAVLYGNNCVPLGSCPPEREIWRLADWLVERGREEIFHTDCLPATLDGGDAFRERASGVLAISVSKLNKNYVLWFRPEFIQTVNWTGDPRKPVERQESASPRLSPGKSFEAWKHTVRGRSLPWHQAEIQAAAELRNAIIAIVLRKAEELAVLSAELQRSNKELETFSYSVSHDLRAPFRHILGYAELLKHSSTTKLDATDARYLDIIVESAQFAGLLVDSLLGFSQVGRAPLTFVAIDMNALVRDVRAHLQNEAQGRHIDWLVGPLPPVRGDFVMLRLVWQNLLHNALKYTRTQEHTTIEIAAQSTGDEFIFSVRDNGVGFDAAHAEKLFGVFQRLHRMEDYEGTGIGLANVRRMVARHGGRTWAEGALNQGACFYFSLPQKIKQDVGSP